MKTRQWEGEVERGSYGLRIGGDDLNLDELLEPGSHVRVTIVWPDQDADGEALYRIMAPAVGTLPARPGSPSEEEPSACLCEWRGDLRAATHADCPIHGLQAGPIEIRNGETLRANWTPRIES